MILKSPAEIALNDLHVALLKAADQYEHAGSMATEPQMAGFLQRLAAERRQMAATLEDHIRQIGLPRMPHPEREGLEKLATKLKAAVSGSDGTVLANDQKVLEREIAAACVAALQERLSGSTRAFVRAIAQRVLDDQERFCTGD
jgi:hypothetical protein